MNSAKMEQLITEARREKGKDLDLTYHLLNLAHFENYLPKPKGIFSKKCPVCSSSLNKRYGNDNMRNYIYYQCAKCDYEYVKTDVA